MITRDELEGTVAASAYDAIARLRPLWLSRHRSETPLLVYVDHRPVGGLDALRDIPAEQIQSLKYLPPVDARLAYNTQAGSGVVEVTLR